MSAKTKFPAAVAEDVARELCRILRPLCDLDATAKPYLICAGSLRRRKREVGDLELIFISRMGEVRDGLFTKQGDLIEAALNDLLDREIIRKRPNTNGGFAWGAKNKLAVHCAAGLPVDFFATTARSWWNYVVCRTGSADSNTRIASAALARGLRWHPYSDGFEVIEPSKASAAFQADLRRGQVMPVHAERDVFAIAGLPYLEPWER